MFWKRKLSQHSKIDIEKQTKTQTKNKQPNKQNKNKQTNNNNNSVVNFWLYPSRFYDRWIGHLSPLNLDLSWVLRRTIIINVDNRNSKVVIINYTKMQIQMTGIELWTIFAFHFRSDFDTQSLQSIESAALRPFMNDVEMPKSDIVMTSSVRLASLVQIHTPKVAKNVNLTLHVQIRSKLCHKNIAW